jgi:uncharacterized repeat protein (TIGR03803 family)
VAKTELMKNLFSCCIGRASRAVWFLPMVVAVLGLMPVSRVSAQTFANLHNFAGGSTDGANPFCSLVLSGNTLYGTTSSGAGGYGSVFAVNTDGTCYVNLYSFANGDGTYPYAGLTLSGNTLYGTTSGGGYYGTVFAINTDGSGVENDHPFVGSPSDGSGPVADLILSGSTLYGTTTGGGSSGGGTVFSLGVGGGSTTLLHSFTGGGGGTDGETPRGGLVLSGNTLYGTTYEGASAFGSVFSVGIDGTRFAVLHTCTGGTNGSLPRAGVVLVGNTLYGTTSTGGANGVGLVFSINTDGSGYADLHDFAGSPSDGYQPYGAVVISNGIIYGTTIQGGAGNNGTVFMLNTNGTGYSIFYSFTASASIYQPDSPNSDGSDPSGGLILFSNTLYGTTGTGGTNGFGTVFSLTLPVPLPQLEIVLSGTNVILTWTNVPPGFTLESTTNLASSPWTPVLPAPVIINGQNTVTNPISGTQQFYELSP